MLVSEYTMPGRYFRDHLIDVPLDWFRGLEGPCIRIFVREVVDPSKKDMKLPLLVFLQGGPGGKSPRPTLTDPAWLTEALKSYRVILPDQRGTGRSTPVDAKAMSRFENAQVAGTYLTHFRADSIVRDLEHLRRTMFGGARWQTLGQSYGGFLTMTYLSHAPEALDACYIAGGLASISPSADAVYRLTFPRVEDKTWRFYRRYPDDVSRIGALADFLEGNDVRLPDGDRLTVRRLQTVGIDLGMGPGLENIHWLIDEAFVGPENDRLSDHFLAEIMRLTSYDSNPLFMVLHESIYGCGLGSTSWAAQRVRDTLPQFDPRARPLLFTGEMMFPWMLDEMRSLRPFKAGAEALARRPEHSHLYDPARLSANGVPVAAVIYQDDMYVDAGLSLETAAKIGNLEYWITNEFEHDGIRQSPKVFERLLHMVKERGGPRSA